MSWRFMENQLIRKLNDFYFRFNRDNVYSIMNNKQFFVQRAIQTVDWQGELRSCQVRDRDYNWSCRFTILAILGFKIYAYRSGSFSLRILVNSNDIHYSAYLDRFVPHQVRCRSRNWSRFAECDIHMQHKWERCTIVRSCKCMGAV